MHKIKWVNALKAINRIKNYFNTDEYFVSYYENHIYIANYKKLSMCTNDKCIIEFNGCTLLINGLNFKLTRNSECDIEIEGLIKQVEFKYDK